MHNLPLTLFSFLIGLLLFPLLPKVYETSVHIQFLFFVLKGIGPPFQSPYGAQFKPVLITHFDCSGKKFGCGWLLYMTGLLSFPLFGLQFTRGLAPHSKYVILHIHEMGLTTHFNQFKWDQKPILDYNSQWDWAPIQNT